MRAHEHRVWNASAQAWGHVGDGARTHGPASARSRSSTLGLGRASESSPTHWMWCDSSLKCVWSYARTCACRVGSIPRPNLAVYRGLIWKVLKHSSYLLIWNGS